MALNLTIKEAVVVIISIIMVVVGFFLVLRISEVKEILHELPVQEQEEKIIVEVEPASSQQGTLFLIKANYFGEREQQDLRLIIESKKDVTSMNLYDDGKHYDEKVSDGIYGGFFDSKGKTLGKYEVKNKRNETLSSFVVHEPGCEIIEGASGGDKIDFIILPFGYNNYDEFKNDAKKLITGADSLLKIEPFKSNKNKFAFFIVNTSRDLKCEIGCKNVSTFVCCDNKIISEEASRCHYDSILILFKSKALCGSASYYAKICSKNELSNLVLVHEIGHSFADLADEYVYSEFYNYSIGEIESINCDKKGCVKWKNITDGCFKGCTYSSLYRPAEEESIMYGFVPVFNPVCEAHIKNLIENYTKKGIEMEKAFPQRKSYFVNLNYNKGEIKIKDVFLKPVKSGVNYRESGYSAELKDKDGNSIFISSLYVPDKIYPIPGSGKMIFEKEVDFSLILPYFSEVKDLMIYRKDRLIANTSLAVFSETCGNNICDEVESHLSCSEDCGIEDNFCETAFCDPDCPSQKNCDRNEKIIYIFSIFLISGALVLLVIAILSATRKKCRRK